MSNQIYSNENDIYDLFKSKGRLVTSDGSVVKIINSNIENNEILSISDDNHAGTQEDPYIAEWRSGSQIESIKADYDPTQTTIGGNTYQLAKSFDAGTLSEGNYILYWNFQIYSPDPDNIMQWQVGYVEEGAPFVPVYTSSTWSGTTNPELQKRNISSSHLLTLIGDRDLELQIRAENRVPITTNTLNVEQSFLQVKKVVT